MKKSLIIATLAGMFAIVACGPSAEEKAAKEKAMQDSMAKVEETKAADAAAQMQAEKAKQDSMSAAMEQMKQDSIAKAEEAAKSKGGKKK